MPFCNHLFNSIARLLLFEELFEIQIYFNHLINLKTIGEIPAPALAPPFLPAPGFQEYLKAVTSGSVPGKTHMGNPRPFPCRTESTLVSQANLNIGSVIGSSFVYKL